MKIADWHYKILKDACDTILQENPDAKKKYAEQGLSDKRFRWDVFYAARIDGESSSKWICDNLYPYLNDTHIDTALRKIMEG